MTHPDDHAATSDTQGHHTTAHHEPAALAEPQTPAWLPALGAGLFGVLALGWLASRTAAPTLSELAPPPASASAAAAPPAPAVPEPSPEPAAAPAPPAPAPTVAAPSGRTGGKGKARGKAKTPR